MKIKHNKDCSNRIPAWKLNLLLVSRKEPEPELQAKSMISLFLIPIEFLTTQSAKYFPDNWLKQPNKPLCQISQKENDIQFWVWNLNWKREEIRWLPLLLQKF